jgi:beta-1,4-mannosyl-glycoprotein beta-1,4-N-acetylglucosaminyltransferase
VRIDCFLYNGEIEVLTLRLATLGGVVDRFVLVESTKTFSGHEKPLHFASVKAHFASWGQRIQHIVLQDEPVGLDGYFLREAWQRQQLARGLVGMPEDAQVLIGDVDELPDPALLPRDSDMRAFRMALYYYDATTLCTSRRWLGTVVTRVSEVRRIGAEQVRRLRDAVPVIEGGWHFSHTGGVQAIGDKLRAGSHTEMDTPGHHAAIGDRMATATDLFGREEFQWERGALRADLPAPLRVDPDRWPGLSEGRWT